MRISFLLTAGGTALAALLLPTDQARAIGNAPAGYQVVDLNIGTGSFGVSPGGRLVTSVAGGGNLTVTLYDRYLPAGRQQLGQVVFTAASVGGGPVFATNFEFDGESRVVFGENFATNTVYAIDFAAMALAAAALAPSGSFPGVQGVELLPGRVIGEGSTNSFGVPGNLYLRNLDTTSGNVTPIVQNVAGGFASGTAITPAGRRVLLDSNGVAKLFDAAGNPMGDVSLAGGNGFGAFEIDFDTAGLAYVTTGDTVTRISAIDSSTPLVEEFGDVGSGFHAGVAFTGGDFRAFHPEDTGALLVGDGIAERLYAVLPVPEPTGLMLLALAGVLLARGRRVS